MDTWCNNQQGDKFIFVRLDRFMATKAWIKSSPYYRNNHLPKSKSDHKPILLEFKSEQFTKKRNTKVMPRRFENIWMENPDINKVIQKC